MAPILNNYPELANRAANLSDMGITINWTGQYHACALSKGMRKPHASLNLGVAVKADCVVVEIHLPKNTKHDNMYAKTLVDKLWSRSTMKAIAIKLEELHGGNYKHVRISESKNYEGINFRVTQRGGDKDLRLANLIKAIKYVAEQQGLTEIVELLSK